MFDCASKMELHGPRHNQRIFYHGKIVSKFILVNAKEGRYCELKQYISLEECYSCQVILPDIFIGIIT